MVYGFCCRPEYHAYKAWAQKRNLPILSLKDWLDLPF